MIDRHQDNNEDQQDFPWKKLAIHVFESVMAFFYLAVAYMLLFTMRFSNSMLSDIRYPLGILLAVYGLFRVYRAVRQFFNKNSEK